MPMRRLLPWIFIACLSPFASAQWSVNALSQLQWSGKPYAPVGLRIPGTLNRIQQAKDAGILDVVVDLPRDGRQWKEILEALEAAGMRYILSIDAMAPMATGYVVEPEGYRVASITSAKSLNLSIPGCESAFAMFVSQRDGSVTEGRPLNVRNGSVFDTFNSGTTLEHVLLLYPKLQGQAGLDMWEQFDQVRDTFIRALSQNKLGPGCRGILNPIGHMTTFPTAESQTVPTSRLFQIEFEAYLRTKYTSPLTCLRAWQIRSPDFENFEVLARLVPLWSKVRGVGKFLDPVTNKLYDCDHKRSTAWRDINAIISETAKSRYSKLVASIQSVWKVPVYQDWHGWAGVYSESRSDLQGISVNLDATVRPRNLDTMAGAVSTVSSWGRPGLSIAGKVTFPDGADLSAILEDVHALGSQACYFATSDPVAVAQIALLAKGAALKNPPVGVRPLYYPDPYRNPGTVSRVGAGRWWLPGSASGERIDLGTAYGCYRYDGSEPYYLLWRTTDTKRVKLRSSAPKTLQVQNLDGGAVDIRVSKNAIEFELGSSPVKILGSDEPPAPEDSYAEVANNLASFFGAHGNTIPNADSEALLLRDLLSEFGRSPGFSVTEMHNLQRRVAIGTSKFLWIEAETPKVNQFSDSVGWRGASGGGVLRLKSRIPSDVAPITATYLVNPRVAGSHEFWIAAQIPEDLRATLTLQIGDRAFRIEEAPVSPYGTGFAWYRLGTTELLPGELQMELFVDCDRHADMLIDAIMIAPGSFRPNGPNVPIIVPLPTDKKP
jgi:hypothetical protein